MSRLQSLLRKFVLLLAPVLIAAPALAQQGEWQGPFTVAPKWGPFLDVEGMVGTQRRIGELDLFVPLGQNEQTLLFADFRFKADDQNSLEGNLGLGARHMLPGGWNLGGYGYFDRRQSPNYNYFNQLTFGAEMLGTNFDFRANTYWPIGQTSASMGTVGGGPPTAAVSGTTLNVTFPGSTTSTEYALTGFDAEAGVRVPIFDTTGPYDLRFYAGGYRFSDGVTPVIAGPRLRLEFTNYRIPELWGGTRLMAGVEYQYDDVRGSQGFASLRLRVPLQAEARRGSLNYQERRMTDPIVRDVDIVSQVHKIVTPTVTEAATAAASGQTLVVVNSASTSGANLPTAVTNAGANSTVVLSGTFNTTTTTTLRPGQIMVGSGPVAVRTASGRTVTANLQGSGTITGTGIAGTNATLHMATNSTLSGMRVVENDPGGANSVAVRVDGVSNVTIVNNTLVVTGTNGSSQGLMVFGASSNVTVSGNSITAQNSTGGTTIGLNFADGSSGSIINNMLVANGGTTSRALSIGSSGVPATTTTVTVSGNTLNASGATLNRAVDFLGTAVINAGSTGNVLTNGVCNTGGNTITGSILFTNGTSCP